MKHSNFVHKHKTNPEIILHDQWLTSFCEHWSMIHGMASQLIISTDHYLDWFHMAWEEQN